MKRSRPLLLSLLLMAAVFTGCNNEDCRQDPDPLKDNLSFDRAAGSFVSENAGGETNTYVITFSNTSLTRTDEVAVGETLSLELISPVSDNLKAIPAGTYTFSAEPAPNTISAGRNSYMTSVYSEVAHACRYITGGSVTVAYGENKYTLSGKLSSKDYEFEVDYTGAIDVTSEYSRIITFEKTELMNNTGNQNIYNNILWGIDRAEEDENYGWLVYEGVLYEDKGVKFGHFWTDYWGSWDTWGGFAVSYNYDMETSGVTNQFSAYASDSGKFGIAYDQGVMMGSDYARPFIEFTPAAEPISIKIANSTYVYLYCVDRIASGAVADFYFILTITGYAGETATGTVNVDLAKNGVTLADWTEVDLTPLGEVNTMKFTFDTNDANAYGSLVPAYCCIDDIKTR